MKRTYKFHDLNTGRIADAAEAVDASMALTYLATATAAAMLATITATGLYMALYAALPGITGSGEIVGGTGYTGTRMPVTWGTVTAGVVQSNDIQTFPMLVTEASGILGWGLWSAATGGTFLTGGATSGLSGSIPSGSNVTFTNALTLTVSG